MKYSRKVRLALICIAAICCTTLLSCGKEQSDKADSESPNNLASAMADKDSVTIALVGQDSVSVFDLLKQSHQIDSWSTVVGTFINGIDSLKNGPRAFWVYSVNDTMPDIASDRKLTKTGDKVTWHFRKLQ